MISIFGRQRKPHYVDDFIGLSHHVFRNWNTLESGNRASSLWLSFRIDRLYRELCATPEFRSKVRQTRGLASCSTPYHWIPLLERRNCRSGLLFLPPGGQIAMHDHQDSIGVSIVLEGTPLISQCDWVPESRHSVTPVAQEKVSHRRLQPHQKSFIFPYKNNIHGFSSTGSSCLLLNTVIHKKAICHHSYLPGQLIDRSLSRQRLSSYSRGTLLQLCFSVSLSLSASVYACETTLPADNPVATAMAGMPFDTLERVALDGDVKAQITLAERYYCGDGVKKDLYRASIWYRRAAEGGFADAQYQFGIMMLDGEGITEDSDEGLEWIFRASQAGHCKATEVFNYLMANPAALDC